MAALAVDVETNARTLEVSDCRAGRSESVAREPRAWRDAGAVGRGTVRAFMVVTLGPRRRALPVLRGDGRGCITFVLCGHLVLGTVGPLQCLQPHARRGYDANEEHQEPNGSASPRSTRTGHHDRTIGAPALGCNGEPALD